MLCRFWSPRRRPWSCCLRDWVENFWIKYCLRCWCTKRFDLSSSFMASCVARFMMCWVCRLYFSGLVCLVLSPDEYLIKKLTMDDFVYVFVAWRKWSCGVICVWPRTNSDTIVSMLEWMIYGGKLIWCDLLTSKIYQVEGTVLVTVPIFLHKINTYHLKRW